MRRVFFCFLISLWIGAAVRDIHLGPAFAQGGVSQSTVPLVAGQWELLASVVIAPGAAKTRLALSDNDKRTRGARLRVTRGSLAIKRAVLSYANGQQHIEEKPFAVTQAAVTQPTGPPRSGTRPNDPTIDEREARMGAVVVDAVEVEHAAVTGEVRLEVWGLIAVEGGTRSMAKPEAGADYREVEVLFGTSRKLDGHRPKNGRDMATFGAADGGTLTRGRALVTIPQHKGRVPGAIPRPTIDLVLFRFDLRKEDPKRDFTIAAVDVLSASGFATKLSTMAKAGKTFPGQAFVFIHGYNTNFDDAVFRAAQITHDIGFDGAPIVFSWQSRGGTLDYDHDQAAIGEAKAHLADLLLEVSAIPGVQRVHVVAHSMGSDVLVRALTETTATGADLAKLKLGEIVFAAPDVDRASFARVAPRLRALARGGVTLYASSADKPLKFSSWKTGRPRAGEVPKGASPIILAGVDTIDISQGSTEVFALHHTEFAERQHLLTDIHTILLRSSRPPHVRASYLYAPIGQAPQVYWLYQRN